MSWITKWTDAVSRISSSFWDFTQCLLYIPLMLSLNLFETVCLWTVTWPLARAPAQRQSLAWSACCVSTECWRTGGAYLYLVSGWTGEVVRPVQQSSDSWNTVPHCNSSLICRVQYCCFWRNLGKNISAYSFFCCSHLQADLYKRFDFTWHSWLKDWLKHTLMDRESVLRSLRLDGFHGNQDRHGNETPIA